MTFPNVVKLLLMFAPSFKRVPLAPVDSARSDPGIGHPKLTIFDSAYKKGSNRCIPAKSTSEILLTFSAVNPEACNIKRSQHKIEKGKKIESTQY